MENKSSRLFYSLLFPVLFVGLLWLIRLYEYESHNDLYQYGIYPRTVQGLVGIVAAPLLHANADHLLSNTLPLLILGSMMFYFYSKIAFQVFFWVYLMTGVWVWAAARDSYHIGASGILYGFVAFLFFSGVFRKDTRLMALSLFVVFLYGSTVWGIFPLKPDISFESHLLGALAGLITAYNFRNEGPVAKTYDLGDEEENAQVDVRSLEERERELEQQRQNQQPDIRITYTIVPRKDPEKEPEQ